MTVSSSRSDYSAATAPVYRITHFPEGSGWWRTDALSELPCIRPGCTVRDRRLGAWTERMAGTTLSDVTLGDYHYLTMPWRSPPTAGASAPSLAGCDSIRAIIPWSDDFMCGVTEALNADGTSLNIYFGYLDFMRAPCTCW